MSRPQHGDIIVQKTLGDIQVEGIFDNTKWVVIDWECVSFDGNTHCSIPFIMETEYEIVGNIAALLPPTTKEEQ